MTVILIFALLAAGAWALVTLVMRDQRNDPSGSVAGFNRALDALDPRGGARRRGTGGGRPGGARTQPRRGGRPQGAGRVRAGRKPARGGHNPRRGRPAGRAAPARGGGPAARRRRPAA